MASTSPSQGLSDHRLRVADEAPGFMPIDEARALHDIAARYLSQTDSVGLGVEIGTYCGKSTVHLGHVARSAGATLVTVDHHRGSEENQAGWEHHDREVVDPRIDKMDTLPFFRAAIHDAGLEASVIGVVGRSPAVARHWTTPLAFLFIDGGHG